MTGFGTVLTIVLEEVSLLQPRVSSSLFPSRPQQRPPHQHSIKLSPHLLSSLTHTQTKRKRERASDREWKDQSFLPSSPREDQEQEGYTFVISSYQLAMGPSKSSNLGQIIEYIPGMFTFTVLHTRARIATHVHVHGLVMGDLPLPLPSPALDAAIPNHPTTPVAHQILRRASLHCILLSIACNGVSV